MSPCDLRLLRSCFTLLSSPKSPAHLTTVRCLLLYRRPRYTLTHSSPFKRFRWDSSTRCDYRRLSCLPPSADPQSHYEQQAKDFAEQKLNKGNNSELQYRPSPQFPFHCGRSPTFPRSDLFVILPPSLAVLLDHDNNDNYGDNNNNSSYGGQQGGDNFNS